MSKRKKNIIAKLDQQIARCQRTGNTGDSKSDEAYTKALAGLAATFQTARDEEAQKIGVKPNVIGNRASKRDPVRQETDPVTGRRRQYGQDWQGNPLPKGSYVVDMDIDDFS